MYARHQRFVKRQLNSYNFTHKFTFLYLLRTKAFSWVQINICTIASSILSTRSHAETEIFCPNYISFHGKIWNSKWFAEPELSGPAGSGHMSRLQTVNAEFTTLWSKMWKWWFELSHHSLWVAQKVSLSHHRKRFLHTVYSPEFAKHRGQHAWGLKWKLWMSI